MPTIGDMRLRPDLLTLLCFLSYSVQAADTASLRALRPDLFHPETGYRIERQRAPTPDDIPGPARMTGAPEVRRLLDEGAVAIDVFGALQSRYDELDGTWLVNGPRDSLPGAIWLPEVGRGYLTEDMQAYLADNLERLSGGDRATTIIVFCVADCWMSWNAAQRIAALGYENVAWFRLGTDGWQDEGWPLAPVEPVPLALD